MISFINTFLSYVVLMLIIVAVGAVGIFIGITMRKRKNAAELVEEKAENE